MVSPAAAYQASEGGALDVDRDFYRRLADGKREMVDSFQIPIRSGRAWTVPRGHLCRLVTVEGPQVGDLNVWNANDPRERLWASRTRQLQRAHVSTYDRLWSTLPFFFAATGHGHRGHSGRLWRGRPGWTGCMTCSAPAATRT
ncbi:urea carboxylase-associated family protein [Fodinicola feengrottensis]|uniref:urea carboxylase-associated family protein n=1 Tax=Fodinicola feengrottensis TaxID=435914 RepID=UPI002443159B|nr:urea carboxylase-associated family protein [Fodinicola feengrottensis]